MRSFLLATAFMLLSLSGPVSAQDNWWIDDYIAECRAKVPGQRILAAASTGASHCIYGYPASQEQLARVEVVRLCNRANKGPARQLAECQVVWSNGKILAPAFYRAMTREFRVPVKIRARSGETAQEASYDGYMIAGKSRKTAPGKVDNIVRIVLKDGTEICQGLITPVGFGITFQFKATCFGNQVLSGKGRIKGATKVDGYYRYADFTATISNPPNRMDIWTP